MYVCREVRSRASVCLVQTERKVTEESVVQMVDLEGQDVEALTVAMVDLGYLVTPVLLDWMAMLDSPVKLVYQVCM